MIHLRYLQYCLLIMIAAIMHPGCAKTTGVPSVPRSAALTVVNAVPNSVNIVPVINTSSAIMYFSNAQSIGYGNFWEYSPSGGNDTVYAVQQNSDTLNIGPKSAGLFYNILDLKVGGIYSLFLTGADTSSPDYLLTTDSLPYQVPADSTVGIRFVNLSTGSSPMSINLEGSPNGSEVSNLPYKGITGFKNYLCNSTLTNGSYTFVIRDAATGDSLIAYTLFGIGSGNGIGLGDPTNPSNSLIFRNITIAVYGSENLMSNSPLNAMGIDNY